MARRRHIVSSPSRYSYTRWIACSQSIWSRSAPHGTADARRQVPFLRVFEQPLLQLSSSAMDATHHGADGNVEDLGDLLVGEALDVGEDHGHPELLRQRLEGLLDLVVGECIE